MTDSAAHTLHELVPVTVARGDGIGPEIMDAVLSVLDAANAPLAYDHINVGREVYEQGHSSGIAPEAWESILRTRVLLKAPITTPLGGGYNSLNVTIRKTLNMYANVRPTKAYSPYVASLHPGMDLVIIRENEEDLYSGIEHQQTPEVAQVLKLITYPGSERIIRYAFEYARAYGRRKVTCMTKDNIMKITDGLFHRVFTEIAAEYPEIESEHMIIDIGAARLAAMPERFDVIVTLNLYGDILSDIAAQIAGSVGLAESANIGPDVAMFEAVHGSAPDIAGKGIANPSGLLAAATQMLVHVGLADYGGLVRNAWLKTLEDGIHTTDIFRPGLSRHEVGTEKFTQAVIDRLGQQPRVLRPVEYRVGGIRVAPGAPRTAVRELVGVDVFVYYVDDHRNPDLLGQRLEAAVPPDWRLSMITSRGVRVYPEGMSETFLSDHWRCRFVAADGGTVNFGQVLALLAAVDGAGIEVIKTEHLYLIDGKPGFSLGQGE